MVNKKSKLILVIFIIFIMITSAIGFFSFSNQNQDTTNTIDYNGFKFTLTQDGRWSFNKNNVDFIFDNSPNDLVDINLPEFQITQNKVYLLYNASNLNPSNDYNIAKLSYTLQNLGIRPVIACINEENCPSQYPIKSCNEESFYFKLDNDTKVYNNDKCLVIQGDKVNINKIVDKVDLKLLGII